MKKRRVTPFMMLVFFLSAACSGNVLAETAGPGAVSEGTEAAGPGAVSLEAESFDAGPVSGEIEVTAAEEIASESPAAVETEISYVDPEGEVWVDPVFTWLDDEQTRFTLEVDITNRSNMKVPDTELTVRLPEAQPGLGSLSFLKNAEVTESAGLSAMLTTDRDGAGLCFTVPDLGSGDRVSFRAEGRRTPEMYSESGTAGPEASESGIAGPEASGSESPEADATEGDALDAAASGEISGNAVTAGFPPVRLVLTLRGGAGSGLEHVNRGELKVPEVTFAAEAEPEIEAEVPEEIPEEPAPVRTRVILTSRLTESGHLEPEAPLVDIYTFETGLQVNKNSADGKKSMAFLRPAGIGEVKQPLSARLLSILLPLAAAAAGWLIVSRIWAFLSVLRREKEGHFDPKSGFRSRRLSPAR